MKKSKTIYINPREAKGLLTDAVDGLSHYNYATTKTEAKDMYLDGDNPVAYKVTTIVERVKPKKQHAIKNHDKCSWFCGEGCPAEVY